MTYTQKIQFGIFASMLCLSNISIAAPQSQISTTFTDDPRFITTTEQLKKSSPYHSRFELRTVYGNLRSLARPMILMPLFQTPNKITYINFIGMGDTDQALEGNLGFGARWLKAKYILGGFLHLDYRRSKHKNTMYQATAGLEYFERFLEYRINVYYPFQDRFHIKTNTVANANPGTTINTTDLSTDLRKFFEVNRPGVDFEFGGQIPGHPILSTYIRAFFFYHKKFNNVYGGQLRLNYQVKHWLALVGSYTVDSSDRKNHFFAGVNFVWQLQQEKYKDKLTQLSRKMVSMPVRDIDIDTREDEEVILNFQKVTKPGLVILIKHDNVDVRGKNSYSSIDKANAAFASSVGKIGAVAVAFQGGELVFTNYLTENDSMSSSTMDAIGLDKLSTENISTNGDLNALLNTALRNKAKSAAFEQARKERDLASSAKDQASSRYDTQASIVLDAAIDTANDAGSDPNLQADLDAKTAELNRLKNELDNAYDDIAQKTQAFEDALARNTPAAANQALRDENNQLQQSALRDKIALQASNTALQKMAQKTNQQLQDYAALIAYISDTTQPIQGRQALATVINALVPTNAQIPVPTV